MKWVQCGDEGRMSSVSYEHDPEKCGVLRFNVIIAGFATYRVELHWQVVAMIKRY